MPGPGRDPFYRRWMMALPEDLDDPRIHRLSLEERGVWWGLLLYSLRASKIPGRFIHPYDEPMSVEDIADGMRCDAGALQAALSRLRATKPQPLMLYENGEWVIPDFERRSTDGEREKLRAAWRERQRRRRGGKDGGEGPKVVPLDRRGGAL